MKATPALVLATLLLAVSPARTEDAPEPDAVAQQLFRKFADRVVQVRILHPDSGSKAGIGSGFVVSAAGHVATNYHVVSEIVHHPDRYRAELVSRDGKTVPAKLVNIDVVHDLAIVLAETPVAEPFELETKAIDKGTRLYSLGNPFDLGPSIVEGTFNGLLEESIYEKIHFTASINPGMSGGPAITRSGRVAGINVSTAGEQVSFLVPPKYLSALIERTEDLDPSEPPPDFLDLARRQLLDNQTEYMDRLLAGAMETVKLGRHQLPGKLAPFLRCWGRTDEKKDQPYVVVRYGCSTDDDLYISPQHSSGSLALSHSLFTSRGLGTLRFYSLYEANFGTIMAGVGGTEEDVTKFSCTTDFVENEGTTLKAAFCVRAYRKLPGLYDAFLKAASLDENDAGVLTSLTLTGVSFDNAERFARRYLETVAWTK